MCNGPEQNWINDSRKGYQFYVAAFNYHKVVEKQKPYDIRSQGCKTFLCSTELSMKLILLINVKMRTIEWL